MSESESASASKSASEGVRGKSTCRVWDVPDSTMRVVHLGRSTCHAVSGRPGQSTPLDERVC